MPFFMNFSRDICTIWRTLRLISSTRGTIIASTHVISRVYWPPTQRNLFLLATKNIQWSDDFKYDSWDYRRYLSSYSLVAAVGLAFCSNSDRDKNEEFLLAAKNSNIASLKRGLSNGVDVNCRHQLGWTALHVSVINGNKKVVEWLIKVGGANVNIQDEYSSARRMARVLKTSHYQIAELRERHFCLSLNHYATYTGFTPLHYAVILDNEDIIQLLLDNGANPSLEDSMGRTPINYCTNESVRKLLEKYSVKFEENELRRRLEERRKYPLEDRLRNHLVGQEGAITTVASAIRRREMGWNDTDHPLVFLFLGSSGIGKTELAKQTANYLHKDNPKGFIRIDMSEYQQKHEVAKLIGAPPGYIGYDQGGQLTSLLKQCPNALVLFDEVEKAHPDVLTVLLQLFDEGRLTDGQGQTISCKDAIFVMTSNLASDEIAQHALRLRQDAINNIMRDDDGKETVEISRDFKENVIEPILKYHFHRDEFIGRINEMVYFLPFSRSELHKLVEQELVVWQKRAMERHQIKLTWDREVLDVVSDGYNVKYGARSIHHEVERTVVNQLALAYEKEYISKGSSVHLIVKKEGKEGREGGHLVSIKVLSDKNTLATKQTKSLLKSVLPFSH